MPLSQLWRKIARRDPQQAPLTFEDYLYLDSIKRRPGDASEIELTEECFGIGRDIDPKPVRARKSA